MIRTSTRREWEGVPPPPARIGGRSTLHIPDGYLSPIVSVGLGVVTVPGWGIATNRVQKVLSDRTIPLLAVFSAMSFTIMMFNIPVPGGTTAHGVGGTLIAIVLGPWAAAIAVSVALIIQALFFGDGGVLAIFANCLNMAFILPFAGYAVYRLLAGRSSMLSERRVWAAGIGAYVGITASAIAVGVQLGVQPILFTQNGHALYSPYGLDATLPAMLLAHMFGASIVEALITAFGIAWIQSRHPEYLTRGVIAGPEGEAASLAADEDLAPEPAAPPRPLWQTATILIAISILLIGMAGLVTGGGDVRHAFGADWGAVDWAAVASMLLIVGAIAAVLIPLAWFLLPRRIRGIGTAFTAAAILAPLGLIAPGFAYGEGSAEDVAKAFGYVPSGLQQLGGVFSAPLVGYEVPLPFLSGANAKLWQTAIGYELAAIAGFLLLGASFYVIGRLLARGDHAEDDHADGSGWLEHTVSGITHSVERSIFTEEHARSNGWLQHVDPRAKLGMFLAAVLAASLSSSVIVLAVLYVGILLGARASRIPFDFFVKRVWLGIPFFAGIIVVPAVFLAPGPHLFDLALGPVTLAPTVAGVTGAILFVSRVGVSVSLAVLLVMTTPWADLLKSLQAIHVPQLFILVLAMAYRYIFLFLHLANGMFEARKSRIVARTSGGEQRRWITASMGGLLNRSVKMSNDVYAAMVARGFGGTIRTFADYRMTRGDWTALAGTVALSAAAVVAQRGLP
jgi:cobalt ECF transporter T component CbiQ/cobalamin biosynthesis protein CbiM